MDKKGYTSLLFKEKRAYASNVEKYKKMFHASEKIQIKHVQSLSDPFETDPVTSTSTYGVLPSTDNHAVLQQILEKFNHLEQRLDNIEINQQTLSNGQANIVTNQEAIAKKLEQFEENLALKPEIMAQTKSLLECVVSLKKVEGLVCRIADEKPASKEVEAAAMLPLSCVNAVQKMEEKLKDGDFAQAMLKYVQKLKGDSEDIDRIIRSIFTDDVLKLYNWQGRYSRLPFGKLSFCNRILRNVFYKLHAQEFENSIKKAIESSHNRIKHRTNSRTDKRKTQILRKEQATIVSNQEAMVINLEDIEENQHRSYVREDNLERNQQILINDQATIVTNQVAIAKNLEEIEENQHKAYVREDDIERNQQIFRNFKATFVSNLEAIAKNLEDIEENQHRAYVREDNIERNQQILINDQATIVTKQVAIVKNLEEIEDNQHKACVREDNLERNQQILINDQATIVTNQEAIAKNLEEIEENQHKAYVREDNIERNKQIFRNDQATIVTNQEAIAKNLEPIEENLTLTPEIMAQTKASLECQEFLEEDDGVVCIIDDEMSDSKLAEAAAMLPLSCAKSVQEMEDKLKDVDFAQAMLKYLQKLKGDSEDIHRLICCIFTDDLLKQYNWKGRFKKLPFGKLSFCNRILRDVFYKLHAQEFENSITKALESRAHLRKDKRKRKKPILRNDQATFVSNQEAIAKNLEDIEENQHRAYVREANLERNQQILINDHAIIVINQEALEKNLEETEENQHQAYVKEDSIERNQQIFRNDQATIVTNPEAIAKNLEPIEENLTVKPEISAETKALLEFRLPPKRVEGSVCRIAGEYTDSKYNEVVCMLPLRCVISVNEVEEKLKSADFAQAMLTHVQELKGTSEDVNRSIIRGLFTDDLLQLYNWEGRCKKFPFAKLSICNRILRKAFQKLTAQKFEKSIKNALCRSHNRIKNRKY